MSLSFDLTDIPLETRTIVAPRDYPEYGIKAGERIMAPTTSALIWATTGVGMPHITEANAPEFWARLEVVQKVTGGLIFERGEPVLLTLADVRAHVGLRTNVTKERAGAWAKRFLDGLARDAVRRERQRADAA